MQPQQQQPADLSTFTYRIASLEQHVQQLQGELRMYVPARENDLQLQSIRSTAERIERDVQDVRKQVTGLNEKLETQSKEQDKVQINVLKWAIGLVITVLVALLIAHLTHFV